VEKPKVTEDREGMESGDDSEKPYMASMGIYVFDAEKLYELMESSSGTDFGKHIIPESIEPHKVMGYVFDGYWEDIGTIRRFYEVNLDMAAPLPKFNLYDPKSPLYTRPRFLAASKIQGGSLNNVLLADGCRIQEATIRNSVIGLRSIVAGGVSIERSIIMGADFYQERVNGVDYWVPGKPSIGIGPDSVIQGAIIDKNACIGHNVIIQYRPDRPDEEHEDWIAREGIVIVPKNAMIPDGTVI
jgi:glucose-1-phosphate adenylyltransferase